MTIYLDCVFLLNTAMDYFLCLLTARLAGIPLRRKRYLLAALSGGLYAVLAFFPGTWFLSTAPLKIIAGLLIPLIAYRGEVKRFRLVLLFGLMSCVTAGVILGMGLLGAGKHTGPGIFRWSLPMILLIGACSVLWMVLELSFRPAIQHGIHGTLIPVQITIAGKTCSIIALYDTGNQLCDPVDGTPVLVVSQGSIEPLFPTFIKKALHTVSCPMELLGPFREYAPELSPCLLPYRAVGHSSGLLLAIHIDWAEINGVRYQNLTIALTPGKLSSGYDALWGGDLKKGGYDEKTD